MRFGSDCRRGVVAIGLALAVASPALAADLAPHRAIYKMSLHSTKSSSGISGASGAMTYEFGDTCDGWTVANKTVLDFAYNEGGQIATTWDFLTWESKDGLKYRFRVRSTRDGQVTDEIDGMATLTGRGQGGVANFTSPDVMTMELPKGTVFPTEHTRRLIEAAQGGQKVLSRVVFDGSGVDGPFDVNALIGKAVPINANANAQLRHPLQTPSWHMDMAFFPTLSKAEAPDYEVSLRYHVDGVAEDVLQKFGTFSLKANLDSIERLPKPEC